MAGTGVVAGDRRLRRWAVRLLTAAGIAGLAWLFAAFLNSGVASADELPSTGSGAEGSTVTSTAVADPTPVRMNSAASTGSDSNGLLGSLLGTVGTTVTGTVSSLSSSLSDTVSDTVSTLTGTVNGATDVVTGTLGNTVDSVSEVLTPTSSDQSSGSGSGADTQSLPADHAPTKHAAPARNVASKVVSPVATAHPAARPAARSVGHHATVPTARHTSTSTPSPARATHRTPHRQAPDPAPQPTTPDPAVPVTSATSGHGDGGSARGTLAVHASGSFTRSLAALGLHSDRSVSWTARSQGLPATSPD